MSSRTTQAFLEHIAQSAEAIQSFVAGMTFEVYQSNLLVRSGVERQLQILTEAAIRLRGTAEKLCPSIDWRAIRGLGNFLRHEYDFISDRTIWDSVHSELPPLITAVQLALDDLKSTAKDASE